MTLPKRKNGNPLGDKKQPYIERRSWLSALAQAEQALTELVRHIEYLNGHGIGPNSYAVQRLINGMHDDTIEALALRHGRMNTNLRRCGSKNCP